MQFETPTTKAQMYEVLKEIFYYYRIRKDSYEDHILPELTLERMAFTPKTDEELKEIAKTLLLSKHSREKQEYLDALKDLKSKKEAELEKVVLKRDNLIVKCNDEYDKSIKEIVREAQKKGLENSSVIAGKTIELELSRNAKIEEINSTTTKEYGDLEIEIEALRIKIENVDIHFGDIFEAEIDAKVLELLEEQEKKQKEVFKYNNTIEEKCQRYKGTVETTNASLRLRYLDINTEFFSKEQLIDMGYYQDAVDCVCAYYDTMPALDAYRDITNEQRIMVYLEEYYQDVLFMYRYRAGL